MPCLRLELCIKSLRWASSGSRVIALVGYPSDALVPLLDVGAALTLLRPRPAATRCQPRRALVGALAGLPLETDVFGWILS